MNFNKISLVKAIMTYSPGFAKEAEKEIREILDNLWLKKNHQPSLHCEKNRIVLNAVHFDSLIEILFRTTTLVDVRLILSQSQVKTKAALQAACQKIDWNFLLQKDIPVNVKCDSVSSSFYHEGAMKEAVYLSNLSPFLEKLTDDKNNAFSFSQNLFFELFKDKLTISISLSGREIYKRNYKKNHVATAPLREDLANLCLQKMLDAFPHLISVSPAVHFFLPFGGSGTFLFEFLIKMNAYVNSFFCEKYFYELSPLFREKTFLFLKKRAISLSEEINRPLKNVLYVDNASNMLQIYKDNLDHFKNKLNQNSSLVYEKLKAISYEEKEENILHLHFEDLFPNVDEGHCVFMPLNPPYGLRQNSKADSRDFYSKISIKINKFSEYLLKKNVSLVFLILCPSEETWSVVWNKLRCEQKSTFHFMQGGLQIRAVVGGFVSNSCIFIDKNS